MSDRLDKSGILRAVVAEHLPHSTRINIEQALSDYQHVQVVAADVPHPQLEPVVRREAPDVVIVDESVGRPLLMRLKARQPPPAVLVVVNRPAPLYGELLMASGATCIARATSAPDIAAAVDHAACGEPMFVTTDGRLLERREPSKLSRLTPREREVFDRLRVPESDGEIALALHIRPETVRVHTARILRKLEVNRKRELVGWPEA